MRVHVNVPSSAGVHHPGLSNARGQTLIAAWGCRMAANAIHPISMQGACPMALLTQHIYRSSNGDRWLLMADTLSDRKFVRHEANQSSGGQLTDTDVDDFLEIGGSGPEFAALRKLLGQTSEGSA
jgi:hypothetical protein